MSQSPLWAVLAPGEPSWLNARAFAALGLEEGEEDEEGPPFEISLGKGQYHALVGTNPIDIGAEIQIAKELSLECDKPVYSIERANVPWTVMSWRNGTLEIEEVDPKELARSLGCVLPDSEKASKRPSRKPLRTVALIEGLRADEARRALEKAQGESLPPERYHLEDTPQGLLLAGRTGGMDFAHITLSEQFSHATVHGVTASPSLDIFFVTVMRGAEGIAQFTQPLRPDQHVPEVSEIKGERSPERILAALGIPVEWFLNE